MWARAKPASKRPKKLCGKTLKHSGSTSRKLFRSEWEPHENVDFCVFGATSKAQSEKKVWKKFSAAPMLLGIGKLHYFYMLNIIREMSKTSSWFCVVVVGE